MGPDWSIVVLIGSNIAILIPGGPNKYNMVQIVADWSKLVLTGQNKYMLVQMDHMVRVGFGERQTDTHIKIMNLNV